MSVPRTDGSALFIVDVALVGTYNITADSADEEVE